MFVRQQQWSSIGPDRLHSATRRADEKWFFDLEVYIGQTRGRSEKYHVHKKLKLECSRNAQAIRVVIFLASVNTVSHCLPSHTIPNHP